MNASRIALDVMGGDDAPDPILRGAIVAADPKGRWKMPPSRFGFLSTGRRTVVGLATVNSWMKSGSSTS